MGIRIEKFIMEVHKDKILQLCRECYRDRPKEDIDLEVLIGKEDAEFRARKKTEDSKKIEKERLMRCKQS